MAKRYVIIGAGAAGLYTAYRLLKSGTVSTDQGDTLNLFEWSDRPGGRIYTYKLDDTGLYCEFGGMRFATDPNFPNTITEGHVLVQQMIVELGLHENPNRVVPFQQSSDRLYYLRGSNVYESSLTTINGLPYNFNEEFKQFIKSIPTQPQPTYTADTILGQIAAVFAPNLGSANAYRPAWCTYFAKGAVGNNGATTSFPAGTPVQDIGYWNLLYDQLGDEGFDYAADGTGYESNVINWNSADAMQANNDYGSSVPYCRLDGGYSLLFQTLENAIISLMPLPGGGSSILHKQQLIALDDSSDDGTTTCSFLNHQTGSPIPYTVTADVLFLALPRRALELVAQGNPDCALNNKDVKRYLESSIDQPAIKVVMVSNKAWWAGGACKYPPKLVPPTNHPDAKKSQWVGGATITDLPLRMIYYFGNNIPGGPGLDGGPYVLLASYDDMNYSSFWREVEITGDYQVAPSLMLQPLTGPTSVPLNSPMAGLLVKQIAEVHGVDPQIIQSTTTAIFFQDWGQDPFGGGYHGWSSHYNICDVMDKIRAPYQKVLGGQRQTYIVGSCYSFDQAWVEGAFCTAESVLQDFFGLFPFRNVENYQLICKSSS